MSGPLGDSSARASGGKITICFLLSKIEIIRKTLGFSDSTNED